MFKQRMIGILGIGSLGVALATPAFAEVQPGWYVGVSPGQASYDLEQEALDDVVIGAFSAGGAPLVPGTGSSSLDDNDTAWSIFGGYRFNPYIAVEAGYVDLGSAEYRASGVVDPFGAPPLAATATIDLSSSGFTLAGVGSLPIGEMFELHARLGIFFSDTDIDIGITANSGAATGSASDQLSASSEDLFYGVGAAFHFGTSWTLSADWQRYADVGDEENTGEGDIDALSLSLAFRF